MTNRDERIRTAVQKLSEAIWNLDQLQPLERELEEEYRRLQLARGNLLKHVEKRGST
jgi:hypothetical protein